MAGLLFLAFAFLAVGQAGANRNGAQTAADAAALAAALDTRDELTDLWVENVRDPNKWHDIFNGLGVPYDGCARADQLAAQNDATVTCTALPGTPPGYKVQATTNKTVGDSIVPGTEDKKSTQPATAVIDSACTFELPDVELPDPGLPDPGLPGADADVDPLPTLTCDDGEWTPDPEHPENLPKPEDLFDVHLTT